MSSFVTNIKAKINDFSENYETMEKIKARVENAIEMEKDTVIAQLDKTKNLCKELIDLNK